MSRTKKPPAKRVKSLNGNGRAGQARAQRIPGGGRTQSGQPGRNPGGDGASGAAWTTNATKNWPVQAGSPDSDIVLNLDLLRSRSRELYMGNPVAAAAINT